MIIPLRDADIQYLQILFILICVTSVSLLHPISKVL